jgi:hypothetical protein
MYILKAAVTFEPNSIKLKQKARSLERNQSMPSVAESGSTSPNVPVRAQSGAGVAKRVPPLPTVQTAE